MRHQLYVIQVVDFNTSTIVFKNILKISYCKLVSLLRIPSSRCFSRRIYFHWSIEEQIITFLGNFIYVFFNQLIACVNHGAKF